MPVPLHIVFGYHLLSAYNMPGTVLGIPTYVILLNPDLTPWYKLVLPIKDEEAEVR